MSCTLRGRRLMHSGGTYRDAIFDQDDHPSDGFVRCKYEGLPTRHGLFARAAFRGSISSMSPKTSCDPSFAAACARIARLVGEDGPPRAAGSNCGSYRRGGLSIAMHPGSPRQRIDKFIASHECDLMVVATHHLNRADAPGLGVRRRRVSDDSRVPTLFLRDDSKGFIDLVNGACHLETVLIPVGSEVDAEILRKIEAIIDLIAPYARIKMLHIGSQQPAIVYKGRSRRSLPTIDVRDDGGVVETIGGKGDRGGPHRHADRRPSRLERRPVWDNDRTGTAIRAPCPVLAVPMPRNLSFARHPAEAAPKSTTSTARITSPPRWLTSSIQFRTSL